MADISVKQIVFNHVKAFRPDMAVGVNAVIQYKLTGEEGGDYIVTLKDGKCTVAEGEAPAPTVTLSADAKDFKDVLLGAANGMQYFMTGRLKLAGDLNLAMKLTTFFKMTGG
jgi:putative sterol carrier protein